MKMIRAIALSMGLLTLVLWSPPRGSAASEPLLDPRAHPPEAESIYLAQQEDASEETVEQQQQKENNEWDDEEAGFEDEIGELTIADPLYYLNKGIWYFNDAAYIYVGIPAAKGYNFIVPETARRGVTNFFSNWYTPVRLVSCLLQAKWEEAGTETGRFLINTTFGFLGFADLAKEEEWAGWQVADEDIGQVFGTWGIGHGFYLVLPLLGPSSARDGVGMAGNYFLDPLTYLDIKFWERAAISGYRGFAQYAPIAEEYEKFKEVTLDPYTAMRNAYIQLRAREVRE